MQYQAIALVVISAFTHAGWNLIGKKEQPSLTFFLTALAAGALALVPLVTPQLGLLPQLSPDFWFVLLWAGMFQALYHGALAGAYQAGDLSVVYPIARALPLVFTAGISTLLGRGDAISLACLVGCAAIMAGCFLLPLGQAKGSCSSNCLTSVIPLALATALSTVGYSMLDDHCIRTLAREFGHHTSFFSLALFYLFLETVTAVLWMVPMVAIARGERREISRIRGNRLKTALVMGIGITGTYSLVLTAMNFAQDVTYVVAFRQLSIPVGAVLGMVLLREPATRSKCVGLTAISMGLVLVALG